MGNEDYLVHYGVLGMKWGMHRAAKKGTSYSYKSLQTKALEKSLTRAKAKNAKKGTNWTKAKVSRMSQLASASKKSDKKYQEYAKKTSVGKAVAQNLLLGPGARTYQTMRANDFGRGRSIAAQFLPMELNTAIGVSVSTGRTKAKPKKKK